MCNGSMNLLKKSIWENFSFYPGKKNTACKTYGTKKCKHPFKISLSTYLLEKKKKIFTSLDNFSQTLTYKPPPREGKWKDAKTIFFGCKTPEKWFRNFFVIEHRQKRHFFDEICQKLATIFVIYTLIFWTIIPIPPLPAPHTEACVLHTFPKIKHTQKMTFKKASRAVKMPSEMPPKSFNFEKMAATKNNTHALGANQKRKWILDWSEQRSLFLFPFSTFEIILCDFCRENLVLYICSRYEVIQWLRDYKNAICRRTQKKGVEDRG